MEEHRYGSGPDPTWSEIRTVSPPRRVAWRSGRLTGTGWLRAWGRLRDHGTWWGQITHEDSDLPDSIWYQAKNLRPL